MRLVAYRRYPFRYVSDILLGAKRVELPWSNTVSTQSTYTLIASIPVITYQVEKEGFGHLDFVFGLGADTYVNTPIIEKMNELIR